MEEVKRQFVIRLEQDFLQFRFRPGRKFMFRSPRTIFYEKFVTSVEAGKQTNQILTDVVENDLAVEKSNKNPSNCASVEKNASPEANFDLSEEKCGFFRLQILHEVGHALLEHNFYTTDLERLKMERAAWEKARELCSTYGVEYDEDYVETALDSYRDWLHARSRCPRCQVTRFQDDRGEYHCPECEEFCHNGE